MRTSRREFLRRSTAAVAGAGLASSVPAQLFASRTPVAPSDRVGVGLIGCRGRGFSVLDLHMERPDVEVVALADVDRSVLDKRALDVEEKTGTKPALYGDFRLMLEDDSIDAVIVGTPDHWHALNTIYACEAGKDVYVEKPMANTLDEMDAMVAAAKRYDRVVQVGQQQRTGPVWHDALDFVRSGKLGTIRTVKAWSTSGSFLPALPDAPVPPGVDYDLWLGPAPERPFNPNRFHGSFRWFWDYAGGLMTDWGVHLIDMVLLGMDVAVPNTVTSTGGIFSPQNDGMETPDTQYALYDYGHFVMSWEHAKGRGVGPYDRHHAVVFIGDNGTLSASRGGWQVDPVYDGETPRMEAVPEQPRPEPNPGQHHVADFVESVKTRQQPACPPEVGRLAALNALLGNVAYRTGRHLTWDRENDRFADDAEANALLQSNYRAPWRLPKI